MRRRDCIKGLCAAFFSLGLIKNHHLGWWNNFQFREDSEDMGIIPLDEYRKKMGLDSLIVLDEITGSYKEFIDWNELIDWCMKNNALTFSI